MNAPSAILAAPTATNDTLAPPSIKMAAHIFRVANLLVPDLARGRRITATALRSTMETACGGSDADGAWIWRDAYEACEAAQVLFLRKYGPSMRRQAATPAGFLAMLARVAALLPTQTRRSEDSQAFQQFSTPIALGFVAAHAASIAEGDHVLDTLGAITKGQRQTGGQGLFRADDNLESVHARAVLRQFYAHLYNGKIDGCALQEFQDATGLSLTDGDGSLKEELPPITTFLNRLLALTIAMQNLLFEAFEEILQGKIEGAIASGSYDAGVETIRAATRRREPKPASSRSSGRIAMNRCHSTRRSLVHRKNMRSFS